MPYHDRPSAFRSELYNDPTKWPLELWASALQRHESRALSAKRSRLFGQFLDPELKFHMRGDVRCAHYINVTRHQKLRFQKELTFEISAYTGIEPRSLDLLASSNLSR